MNAPYVRHRLLHLVLVTSVLSFKLLLCSRYPMRRSPRRRRSTARSSPRWRRSSRAGTMEMSHISYIYKAPSLWNMLSLPALISRLIHPIIGLIPSELLCESKKGCVLYVCSAHILNSDEMLQLNLSFGTAKIRRL